MNQFIGVDKLPDTMINGTNAEVIGLIYQCKIDDIFQIKTSLIFICKACDRKLNSTMNYTFVNFNGSIRMPNTVIDIKRTALQKVADSD